MKFIEMRILVFVALLIFSSRLLAINDNIRPCIKLDADSIKKNNSFGGTPILAYDSDLGLRYGAVVNWFQFGDKYPNYERYAQLKAFNSTKGTFNTSLILDDQKSVKNTRVIFEIGFSQDQALNFYGFNGGNSVFDEMLILPNDSKYYNSFFFSYKRRLLRSRLDFQIKIKESKYNLLVGVAGNRYSLDTTDLSLLHSDPTIINQDITLFEYYNNWNIIPEYERQGGIVNYAKLGFSFDNRNLQIGCTKGIWFESYIIGSPTSKGNQGFIKQITTLRHYLKIAKSKFILTYRLSSQQKLGGQVPSYLLSTYFDSQGNQDGLGGAFTLRGVPRNRIIANGFVLGNFELRRPVFNFNVSDIKCGLEFSLFMDAAYVTQKVKFNTSQIPNMYVDMLFRSESQNLYSSGGIGVYFRYNSNNVISMNYGISFHNDCVSSGLYVGSSFLF